MKIALCEYQSEAGVPGGIVSLGGIPGVKPSLVSPARPERGRLVLGGRARWCASLEDWKPFEDPSVTHALLLSDVFYASARPADEELREMVLRADKAPQAVENPYPNVPEKPESLPRVLFFRRRHWRSVKRLFSRKEPKERIAFGNLPFERCAWANLPFIPSDVPEQCRGASKNPWNANLERCLGIRRSNEAKLMDWAMPVRVRAGTEVLSFVRPEQLHGFLRAAQLWKFPANTKVWIVGMELPARDIEAAGDWPSNFTFSSLPARGGSYAHPVANLLEAGNRIAASDAWIWLDAEAMPMGLNNPARLFAGKEWKEVDWGAPGSVLKNRTPSIPGSARAPEGWPSLETFYWLGAPATLLRKPFVSSLLEAWKKAGEQGDFEAVASGFARTSRARVCVGPMHEWGWRML